MVSDPSSANTSSMALKAMREHNVLDSVIAALVDGKSELDNQVQENLVKYVFLHVCPAFYSRLTVVLNRILHTFAVVCNAPFLPAEKAKLRKFFDEQSSGIDDNALAERWDLKVDELKALIQKVVDN